MKNALIFVGILALSPLFASAADPQREADVAKRGAEAMPFDLQATQHAFLNTRNGGKQRVVARDAHDVKQTQLIRQHLRDIASEFRRGDFGGPERIHGPDMPGLQVLKSAKPGDLAIAFNEVPAGAELTFRASKPGLVQALHAWFDAQRSDHGHDAMGGHQDRGTKAW